MRHVGRKPLGSQLVDRLAGSERAKERLRVILETLSGARTIPEACETLGMGESMFHRLRGEVLQTALDRLEPRALGRPRETTINSPEQVSELEQEVAELRVELQASQVREELAQILPRLVRTPHAPLKKTNVKPQHPKNQPRRGRLSHLGGGKTRSISYDFNADGRRP